ncbi:MAG TPA: Ig-like domain-containing protein, partial [Longimicrobium sp.]
MLANRFRSRASRSVLLALSVFSVSCGGDSPTGSKPEPVTVARVDVAAATERVAAGDTVQLTATARDAAGNAIAGKAMQWTSDNPAVVKVDASTGRATGESVGSATVTASADGQSGRVALAVVAQPVASLTVSPDTATLAAGGTAQLRATARDRRGVTLEGRVVAWLSSAEGVA